MRNVLAHAGQQGHRVVSAFVQEDTGAARTQWCSVADQLCPKVPKVATLMDKAETDVITFMSFPKGHRAKLHSTNPIERLNGEIKRRIATMTAVETMRPLPGLGRGGRR